MVRYASRCGLAVLFAASLAADVRVLAQAAPSIDPFIGSWALDRARSTFSGAAPERRIMKFEKVATGIRHSIETLQGEVTYRLQYVFQVDGKDYPADNQMAVSTVSFKRVDANTLERTGKYQGSLLETVTFTLSADGKTLTANQSANNGQNTSLQVFAKQ